MIKLENTEYELYVKIDDKIILIDSENLISLSIKEDMGAFFCRGKIQFTDVLGIFMREIILKSGMPINIIWKKQDDEIELQFVITEVHSLIVPQSGSTTINIDFIIPAFTKMKAPKISQSFGTVSGSSVITQITNQIFNSISIDQTGNIRTWIQPLYSNQEMVEYIAKYDYSISSTINDIIFYTRKDNSFYYKSLSSLVNQSLNYSISNNAQEGTILSQKFLHKDRALLFFANSGLGSTVSYFDYTTKEYIFNDKNINDLNYQDTAIDIGRPLELEEDQLSDTRIIDYGVKDSSDDSVLRSPGDNVIMENLEQAQSMEVPISGLYPNIGIGDSCNLTIYVNQETIDTKRSGKWITSGIEWNIINNVSTMNITLFRIGYDEI